jgi:hypothetical protein
MVYFPFGPRGSMVSGGQVKASFIPAPARTQCRREKHFFVPVALIRRPFSTASRTRAEGERDEVVQFTPNERLVQITEGALDERLDLPRNAAIAARHHEDWRRHAEIADALQEIEAGGLLHVPVVDHRQDNVDRSRDPRVRSLLPRERASTPRRMCCHVDPRRNYRPLEEAIR